MVGGGDHFHFGVEVVDVVQGEGLGGLRQDGGAVLEFAVMGEDEVREMEADVEALLVNRIGHSRGFTGPEYYIVPIDECYKLVGLIRVHWRGLSGGTEVWQEIGHFFDGLKQRATAAGTVVNEEANA